jgi:hypothetical protein
VVLSRGILSVSVGVRLWPISGVERSAAVVVSHRRAADL